MVEEVIKKETPGFWFYASMIVVVIAIFAMVYFKSTNAVGQECCDKICDKLGSSGCVGFTESEVACKLDYARFGMPEIAEVYRFQVTNKSICKPVNLPVNVQANGSVNVSEVPVNG